ncbi:MAG: HAD hydrolase-like protein [Bacteroidota bacterium]
MHLIIFDIDGTLVDSIRADDACFIQAFWELHQIDLNGADWNSFPHVTDSGLTTAIFQEYLRREPTSEEVKELKARFFQLLAQHKDHFEEIPGAREMLATLQNQPEIKIALATGGWRETAELKLNAVGIEFEDLVFISANDHYDRAVITRLAIEQSGDQEAFETITYVGDGVWDLKTSRTLQIQFAGVDVRGTNKLTRAGAGLVMRDLRDTDQLIRWCVAANPLSE